MSLAPLFRLDDRVALITGGGTGIGRGIAETFLAAGARVVLAGRRAATLNEAVQKLGENALALPADITREEDRQRLVADTVTAFGGLDILVNNAGAVVSRPVAELDEETWDRLLRVNLTAAAMLSRAALPALRERRGSILNISTGASLHPVPGYAVYGASKAALNYASQVLAMEAAPEVRVNVICPGGVETPLFETFVPAEEIPGILERFREMTPLGRVGQPADIAAAALYLSSPAASWVTGAVLTVDGGMNLG
jgi:NAD(P)-dependent dehydrogenase (short-subunit alcohol dehydrogenase family)